MRQSIIFILYLLCTFTARSQSALTPEQTGSIYYAYPVAVPDRRTCFDNTNSFLFSCKNLQAFTILTPKATAL